MRVPNGSKLPERFWSKVAPDENGCWIWTAAQNSKGYGYYWNGGNDPAAHRLAAIDAKGPIPNGQWVLHTCDTRNCVKREHLYFGNHQDNMDDMRLRGRGRWNPQKGESNVMSKLTAAQVRLMRTLYAGGGHSYSSLATAFDVSNGHVATIITRKAWEHV